MQTIAGVIRFPAVLPLFFSQSFACDIVRRYKDEDNRVHLLWAYPLNGLVNLLGIAIQPLASLIALVAAGVFKLISLCSGEETAEEANRYSNRALIASAFIFELYILFVRIIYPAFQLEAVVEKFVERKGAPLNAEEWSLLADF